MNTKDFNDFYLVKQSPQTTLSPDTDLRITNRLIFKTMQAHVGFP